MKFKTIYKVKTSTSESGEAQYTYYTHLGHLLLNGHKSFTVCRAQRVKTINVECNLPIVKGVPRTCVEIKPFFLSDAEYVAVCYAYAHAYKEKWARVISVIEALKYISHNNIGNVKDVDANKISEILSFTDLKYEVEYRLPNAFNSDCKVTDAQLRILGIFSNFGLIDERR